jgi:hypothetical protein
MSKKNSFSSGDLVAVFGGYTGEEGIAANTVEVCRVIICGYQDLLVEPTSGYLYSRTVYLVPKKSCQKLQLNPDVLISSKIAVAKIGDLVLSYSRIRSKDEPEAITGIIYKIIYKFAKPQRCILLCGSEMKEVNYENLIVLERN